MRLGLLLDTHAGDYGQGPGRAGAVRSFVDRLVAEAQSAERLGFDGVFLPERHAREECYVPALSPMLGMLAGALQRCWLGTYLTIAGLHHPTDVAEVGTFLHNVTGGRFVLTLAAGYHPDYFRAFGVPRRLRGRLLEDVTTVVRRSWSGEPFSHDGVRHALAGARVLPRPDGGGFPVWIGGESRAATERAGRLGDAWAVGSLPWDRASWRRAYGLYAETAARHGRTPSVAVLRDALVADDGGRARADLLPRVARELRFYLGHGMRPRHQELSTTGAVDEASLTPHVIVGTVAESAAGFAAVADLFAPSWIIVRVRQPSAVMSPSGSAEVLQGVRAAYDLAFAGGKG